MDWWRLAIWLSRLLKALRIWSFSWLRWSHFVLAKLSVTLLWFYKVDDFIFNYSYFFFVVYLMLRVSPLSLALSICSESSYSLSAFLLYSYSAIFSTFYNLVSFFSSSFFVWMSVILIWCNYCAILRSTSFLESLFPSELTSAFNFMTSLLVYLMVSLTYSIRFSMMSWYYSSLSSPSLPLKRSN
jgi:hypothetical protein